ncbi:MAG TPA: hypothetical protein K8V11_06585 [Dietzia timorensis]|uniref:DUF3093 domain-containing protein n=1 Tax=Dietzia timorensis TaxID=499555 RepID=A0A921F4E7_9ACTN|nr:hypothetical protein [Dietzia timorensis]HJE90658.1 hypothetical protein [Dietzia timorensis]
MSASPEFPDGLDDPRDAGDPRDPGADDARMPRDPDPRLRKQTVFYAEDGWSWAWILAAPIFCAAAGLFEVATGAPVHWLMLFVCALGTMITHGIMIAATRVHGRLRVTDESLWQGTEELPYVEVDGVLPEPIEGSRLLGELRTVPRKRGEVGIKLADGSLVRAFARDPEALSDALVPHVGTAEPPRNSEDGNTPPLDDVGGTHD